MAFAIITYLLILMLKRKSDIIILLHEYIGDQLYGLSFLDDLKASYPKSRIIVFTSDTNAELINSFSQIDKAYLMKKKSIRCRAIKCIIRSSKISRSGLKHKVFNATPYWYPNLRTNNNIGIRQLIADEIYHIPLGTLVTYHNVENNTDDLNHIDTNSNKTALINPYSNSMSYDVNFYNLIVRELIRKGYVIYTNVIKNQTPIEGTLPLKCSIYELFSFCSRIDLFVSVRSGIVDFLIPSDVNLFIIYEEYDERSVWIANHYHISEWKPKGKYKEVYFKDKSSDEYEKTIDTFNNFIESI